MKVVYFIQPGNIIDEGALRAVIGENAQNHGEHLYLYIESPGGDPAAAMRIMRYLQDKYTSISAVVPGRAMSAATLMCLGTNVIYMLPESCLGPLDLQISHPIDESRISSLDIRDTLNTISSLSEAFATKTIEALVRDVGLGLTSASKIAYENAVNIVKPIVDKIDPYHLHSSYRSSQLGAEYANNLLASRMMSDDPSNAMFTAWRLANAYQAHNYVISIDEATNVLHLKVQRLDKLEDWEKIRANAPSGGVVQFKEIEDVLPTEPESVQGSRKSEHK